MKRVKLVALAFAAGCWTLGDAQASADEWKVKFCPRAPIEVIVYKLNVAQTAVTLHPALFEASDVTYSGTAAIFRDGHAIGIFDPMVRAFRVIEEYEAEFFICYETDEIATAFEKIRAAQ